MVGWKDAKYEEKKYRQMVGWLKTTEKNMDGWKDTNI